MSRKLILIVGIAIMVIGVIAAMIIMNGATSDIVGTWQQRGGPVRYQFSWGGAVTETVYGLTHIGSGSYTLIDSHTIRLTMRLRGQSSRTSEVFTVNVNGNTMTLTTGAGVTFRYDRID